MLRNRLGCLEIEHRKCFCMFENAKLLCMFQSSETMFHFTMTLTRQKKLQTPPISKLDTGMYCAATCIQPPGAAHKSTHTCDCCRNSYLRFSCTNLKAARERKPKNRIRIYVVDGCVCWCCYNKHGHHDEKTVSFFKSTTTAHNTTEANV